MLSKTLILPLVLLSLSVAAQPRISKEPGWVHRYVPKENVSPQNAMEDGYVLDLLDEQINLQSRTIYHRNVLRIITDAGVQNASEITASYDPSFEQLIFHYVRIIRDGKVHNVLGQIPMQTIHQEKELDRSVYNGALTALLFLEDVRKGDRIEYAYSTQGFNPVFGNRFCTMLDGGFDYPVAHLHYAISCPAGRNLYVRGQGEVPPPRISAGPGGGKVYEWSMDDLPAAASEDQTPDWYYGTPEITVSEFPDWASVDRWALSLFHAPAQLSGPLAEKVAGIEAAYPTPDARTCAALRFVQDEVRYLGIEMGENTHRPHDPGRVFAQRFGDCKDKSLLLCTMLRAMGITADPVLLNTDDKDRLKFVLPSAIAFDHCTVRVSIHNKQYWLDPTISYQRGNLDHISFPDYRYGLVLTDTTTGLSAIPLQDTGAVTSREVFTMKDLTGPAKLEVISRFTGSCADDERSDLNSTGRPALESDYTQFYGDYYRNVRQADSLTVRDDDMADVITTHEYYSVGRLWEQQRKQANATFSGLLISSVLEEPESRDRSAPIGLTYPRHYTEELDIRLPEEWDLHEDPVHLHTPWFNFSSDIRSSGKDVSIRYEYQTLKDSVSLARSEAFFDSYDEVKENLSYSLVKDRAPADGGSGGKDNIVAYSEAALVVGMLGLFLFLGLQRRRRVVMVVLLVGASFGVRAQDAAREQRVDALLSKMTLEEKVGQMTQVTLDVVLRNGQIDPVKLREAVVKYHVGSILNTSGHALTRDKWKELITAIERESVDSTRLHIPVIYGIDAIHGCNYTLGATLFPQEIAQAATFDPELVQEADSIAAYETRASYIPWNFSPVLDLGKQPLWPRMYETYGEDPYLCSVMGAAAVRGYQGTHPFDAWHVAACMKHYLGYSDPLSGKDRTPAWIPDRYMREYFLPSFRAAVKAGAQSVMVNSSEINGVPVHASKYLLTDVLRGELGFKGVIVSDWQDIKYLHDRHHVAATQEDAVYLAIRAGIDMSMVPYDYSFYDLLLQLVHDGKIPVSRIDASVRRILTLKDELGLFKTPYPARDNFSEFGSESSRQVSLQAAREAITLLKNPQGLLPLSKHARVLVAGPTANTMRSLDGGWSYSWQGDVDDEFGSEHHTILEAIRQKIGADHVIYRSDGTGADSADFIVLCLGESSYAENPGNIDDLDLPAEQIELARKLATTGKPIVLVLAEGRPRIVTEADRLAAATVMAYIPGNEGGDALADILFGDVNPSGKLPYTYPRYPNALVNYYRKNLENGNSDDSKGYHPLYEFGTGLSYTTFKYSNLKVDRPQLYAGEKLRVTVDVTNTGSLEGMESILLYSSEEYASITPDFKRLRAFRRVDLKPGETRTVTFSITPADLAFIGDDEKPVTEPGAFVLSAGDQTVQFTYVTDAPVRLSDGKL